MTISEKTETATGPDADFAAFLAEGRFMIQRCKQSGRFFFYPRIAEPGSGSADLEWVEASGKGAVYSTTVVRNRNPDDDYNVCLVDLDEGPRMMSRVIGIGPDEVRIGQRVRSRIIECKDGPLLVFVTEEPGE